VRNMRTGRWQVVTIVHYFIDDGRTRDEWRFGHVAAWPVSTKTQDGDVAGGREEQSFERRGRRHRRGGCAFGENGGIDFSLSRLAALLVRLPKRQPIQWHGTQINLLMRLSLPFSLGAAIIQFVRNQMRSMKNTSHRHRKSRVPPPKEECPPFK